MNTISEKDLNNPESPGDGWHIIEAAGDFTSTATGRDGKPFTYTQRITPAALAAIVQAGVPEHGLLIDRDHLSHDLAHTTEAMGWVRKLALCGGNLAAYIEWSTAGLPLVQGKVYKHFSTEYPWHDSIRPGGVMVPDRLIGLALTNKPNNNTGQPPITNRGQAANHTPHTHTHMNPDILAKLGLADGATDEEIIAAIDALKNQVEDANAAAEEAAQSEADSLICAEEAANDVELTEEEKEDVEEQLVMNRAHGLRYLRLLCNSKRNGGAATAARSYADRTPAHRRGSATATRRGAVSPSVRAVLNRAHEACHQARARGRHLPFNVAKKQAERELRSGK